MVNLVNEEVIMIKSFVFAVIEHRRIFVVIIMITLIEVTYVFVRDNNYYNYYNLIIKTIFYGTNNLVKKKKKS